MEKKTCAPSSASPRTQFPSDESTGTAYSAGIESLFGTRDENMRLIEEALEVRTRVTSDSIEIEGEDTNVLRAETILLDYAVLLREGFRFPQRRSEQLPACRSQRPGRNSAQPGL